MQSEPLKSGLEFEPTEVHARGPNDAGPGARARLASDTPRAASPRGTLRPSGSLVGTPEGALAQDELNRTRIFVQLTIGMALSVLGPIPMLGGDPIAKSVLATSALLVLLGCAWMLWVLREPETRYAEWKKVVVGLICGGCGCAGVYYWGSFSPACLILGFGVYFVSPHGALWSGIVLYLECALFQLGLAVGVHAGWLVDRGRMAAPGGLATFDFVVLETTVQGILLASFLFARASRATTLHAVADLERTVREAARREALLLEARQDLARALRVGEPGRYTDQTLGSFTLGVLIGHGGMGEVYEARHARTGELAAVKLLHRHLLVDADQVTRFVQEARVVASLDSPHVVRTLEVSDEGAALPYLAMERLVGRDLADLLRDESKLDSGSVRELIDQVARGAHAAHMAGIVHRDLKPQNVFLSQAPGRAAAWKVLDFGLSKLTDQTGSLTRGQVIGTPAYMAPEQARGATIDARTDVYALAAIAYRALTGQPPFHGADPVAVMMQVVTRMPVRPRLLSRELPGEVERVLFIGLAKSPGDRFSTILELAAALGAALDGKVDAGITRRAATLLAKHRWSTPMEPPVAAE